MSGPATITAGRRTVEISRPDKPLFPCGITKLDLAHHYERVATPMLGQIRDRPLNFQRYPDGIEKHGIFQQHAASYFPDWIARVQVPKRGGTVDHVVAIDAATLVYLAGQACITLHAWPSRRDRLTRPDRLIVDLDPSADHADDDVRRAALTIGELLRELGLRPWAMTTGSRGYHVVVALQRRAEFDAIRSFARDFAVLAAARSPTVFTTEQRKAKREGKILIDMLRNAHGHTSVAPYSVRARRGAPVATPLRWEELEDSSTKPDGWTLHTIPDRLERTGDPWHDIAKHPEGISAARRRLDEALSEI